MRCFFGNLIKNFNKIKAGLILVNFLLVFFLILLSDLKVLPMKLGDFIFFSFVYLIFALYRPGWSFLFFIGTIALENVSLAPENLGIFIRPFQLIGGITIFSLLLRFFAKRLNFSLIKLKWFDYALIVFALAGFISALGAADKGLALRQSVILVSFLALYWLVRNYIQTMDDLKRIAPFFLGSSVIIVIYGIWQNIRFIKGLNAFETMPGRPNATFTEADWLGIYLVLLIAVIYVIIYKIFNFQFTIYKQFSNSNFQNTKNKILNSCLAGSLRNEASRRGKYFIPATLYLLLIVVFILLIITVSRSAWLGTAAVTLIFLLYVLTKFSYKISEWQWKEFLRQSVFFAVTIFASCLIVYVFNLTSFQLFNRAQSAGTGLQKITVACRENVSLPEKVGYSEELIRYGCRHINLEEIKMEEMQGNYIKEIYRNDPNINIRSRIYQKSWEEIKKNPILGIGWGNISDILGKDERGTGLNSSNIFLEVWLGSGIIGIFTFIIVCFYILIRSIKKLFQESSEEKNKGLLILLGFFALLVPNLFNAGIFLGIWWLFLGIALSLEK